HQVRWTYQLGSHRRKVIPIKFFPVCKLQDPLFLGIANFLGGLSGGGASGPSYLHLLKTDSRRPRLIKSLRVHSRFITNVRHKTRFLRSDLPALHRTHPKLNLHPSLNSDFSHG
ncbi:unnamed protein product, partial [Ascophyllum nodosum]